MKGPADRLFEPMNQHVDPKSVRWHKVEDDFPCSACRKRGGWLPSVFASACPECLGADEIGESFCAQCEFCCGC